MDVSSRVQKYEKLYKKMIILKQIIFFFFLFATINCNSTGKKKDIWIEKLCCMNDSTKFLINELRITSSNFLEIELCHTIKKEMRVTLMKEVNKGNDRIQFDFLSKITLYDKNHILLDSTSEKHFKGKVNNFKITDGQYYLNLGYGQTCGTIYFMLKNNKITAEEFHCIKKCS